MQLLSLVQSPQSPTVESGWWEWDVAAGSLIASEAGGLATDQNGQELVFNSPIGQLNGIVTSNPCIHAGLMNGLR